MYIFTSENEVLDLFVNGTQSGGMCVNDTIMHYAGKIQDPRSNMDEIANFQFCGCGYSYMYI